MATTKGWSISGTTGTYYDSEGNKVATINGLKSGLKTVDDENGVKQVAGIEVGSSTITLSRNVLGYTDITLTSEDYELDLADDYSVNENAGGWLIDGTTAYLLDGSSSGYTKSSGSVITYTAAQPGNNILATLKGLKSNLSTDTDSQISGIEVLGKTVTVTSKNVLNKETATIEGSGYKLAAGSALSPQATGSGTWTTKGTTATYTTNTSEGYSVDKTGTKLEYASPSNGSVLLSGLVKDVSVDAITQGATINNTTGNIALKKSVLGNKVTIKCTGVNYGLALDESDADTNDAMATAGEAVWNKAKNATKATYTQDFEGKGKYYCDGSTISTLSKDTLTVTLATLSGLAKVEEEWTSTDVDGISVLGNTIKIDGSDTSFVGTSNLTLGKNDPYNLSISGDFAVSSVRPHWEYKSGKATLVEGTTAGFEQKDDKTVAYVKPTSTTLATVTGLANHKDAGDYDDYTPYDAETDEWDSVDGVYTTGTIDGLTFELPEFNSDGSVKTLGTITVSANILEDEDAGDIVKENSAKGIEGVKGVKKLALGAKDNYKFAFADGVNEPEDDAEGAKWTIGTKKDSKSGEDVGTGTWTYALHTDDGWAIDTSTKGASKAINYVAEKTETIATLSNLTTSTDFEVEQDDKYTGRVVDEDNVVALEVKETTDAEGKTTKQIVLGAAALGGKKISLKSANYTLGLDGDYSVKEISADKAKWAADKSGKAVLEGGKTEGYEVDDKGTNINYTAKKVTALATITGLGKNLEADDIEGLNEALNADGVTKKATEAAAGEITLNESILTNLEPDNKLKVALGNKDNYKFVFDGNLDEYGPNDGATLALELKNEKLTGNATYSAEMNSGYVLSGDGKTVTYAEGASETLATLSGLVKDDAKINDDKLAEAIVVSDTDKTFTLKDASVLASGKLSLKNGKNSSYTLAVDEKYNVKDVTEQWDIQGTKATYYNGKSDGYTVDTKKTSITYAKSGATETLASITGLAKDNTVKKFTIQEDANGSKLILITNDAIKTSTSAIKLTTSGNYKLRAFGVPGPQITDSEWNKKDANATITRETSAGWTLTADGKTFNYSKEKSETLVTISGLSKTVSADIINQENLIERDEENNVFTVHNKLLAGTKVTIKGGSKDNPFKLALANDVVQTTTPNTKYWAVSGGKATYYTGSTPHYALSSDSSSIEYKTYKADATLATVSGLSKTATEEDFSLSDDGVITLKASAIDWAVKDITKTKVTLKGDGYTLNADYESTSSEGEEFEKGTISKAWGEVKSGKVLYESGITSESDEGFVVSADGKTFYYGKATDKKTTLATLSGVKATPNDPSSEGVITLDESILDGKKASLGKNDPYTLELDASAPTVEGKWEVKSTTATLKGTKTAGYLLTDSKTVSYTAASTKDETLATVKGVATGAEFADVASGSDSVAFARASDLSNDVTVDGKGILAFEFPDGYGSAKVTGSASNDSLKFSGTGLTVNPAKGNDYVDLGNKGGNTFAYASGDGYDVIANFAAGDKISISKAKAASITKDDENTVITIDNKGSITLQGFTGTPTIEGITATSADLLLDDNYSMTAAEDELSAVINADTGTYTPYKFSDALKLMKEEGLIPQITYTDNKK